MTDMSPAPALSERQLEILRLRAGGFTGPQIAAALHCAVSTVDYHERVIVHVLQARNITNAVHLGHTLGLIAPREDCGSRAAYVRHLRRGEPTDPACRSANAQYMAERRAGEPRPVLGAVPDPTAPA